MRRMLTTLGLAAALVAGAVPAGAQETKVRRPAGTPPADVQQDELVISGGVEGTNVEIVGDTMMFMATEMSVGGKVVKGAPYSATAVTETVQTLGDGNRIVRRNSANVFRDADGRTRRDQTLALLGPFGASGDGALQHSFINDPVAGANYVLDPRTKTARKLPVIELHWRDPAAGREPAAGAEVKTHQRRIEVERRAAAAGEVFNVRVPGPDVAPGAPGVVIFDHSPSKADTKSEKLEKRVVEGVEAEGHRTVTTIPAGEIGNEQPIQIVHERWYSPELQVVVMTRHSDPRFGETTYRLTNINRSAPDASLFQVPADFTLKEGPTPPRGVRRLKRSALDDVLTEN
jgi:hypothetical protein